MTQSQTANRPKIAVIANIYKLHLHTQHIIDRILDGYGWNGSYHHPALDVVSMYVEQQGAGDLSFERAERHPGLKRYPTIAQALTRDTGKLAVDGVIYVGEQGGYPRNQKGQTEYPRYRFFEEVVGVFRASGRSVPFYVDKHFSWKWEWAKEMYDTSRKLGFPLMGGSSLPITWRVPSLEMPMGANVREAMCVAYGSPDSYDIHALAAVQCMVERRKGGETGVAWLQAYRGANFWRAHEAGLWSRDLFNAALCRSHTLKSDRPTFTRAFPTIQAMRQLVPDPVAYHYQYLDGLRATIFLMNGLIEDFNFAAAIEGRTEPLSTEMYLAHRPGATLETYFDPLAYYIEQMMLTRKEPYPVERTLLDTGLVCAGIDSLFQGQLRVATPQLAIAYQAGPSLFNGHGSA